MAAGATLRESALLASLEASELSFRKGRRDAARPSPPCERRMTESRRVVPWGARLHPKMPTKCVSAHVPRSPEFFFFFFFFFWSPAMCRLFVRW